MRGTSRKDNNPSKMPNISENSSQLSAIARILLMDSKAIIHVLYSKDVTVLIDNKDIIHELQRYC